MRRPSLAASDLRLQVWFPTFVVASVVLLTVAVPALLVPVAHGYAALCERFPALALMTNHTPPLPLALPLSLALLAAFAGAWAGIADVLATVRIERRLCRCTAPLPMRLARLGDDLGLGAHLAFLTMPEPVACCCGFLRPRIAVSAGILARLDDEELTAVLAHERAHLRRRDPLRLLLVDALAAAAFMVPLAAPMRRRYEARIEVAADRAALTVAPRGALAGALLALLTPRQLPLPGIAGLTATEARIAQLSGRTAVPSVPARTVPASFGMAVVIVLGMVRLNASADLVQMVCPFCAWLS